MDHVNEFEHGLDIEVGTRSDSLRFDSISNEPFRYSSSEALLETPEGKKALKDMLGVFFDRQKKALAYFGFLCKRGKP